MLVYRNSTDFAKKLRFVKDRQVKRGVTNEIGEDRKIKSSVSDSEFISIL